ncbi:hypothetical protein ABPG72_015940 [Tetrahymena utriculariae]
MNINQDKEKYIQQQHILLQEEQESDTTNNTQEQDSIKNDDDQVTFDDILSKIGFGRYQIAIFVMMGFVGIADAAEAQVLSILQPMINDHWGLKTYQNSIMVSLVFTGYMIGSFISGKVSDKYGRKKPLVYASVGLFLSAILSAFAFEFISFTILRTIFGGFVGFIVPISFSVLAEITPIKQRGVILALVGIFYTFGELFVCLLAFLTLDNLKTGNWRLLLALSTIPSFLIMVLSYLFLNESPRFCLFDGREEQAFQLIEQICQINRTQSPLDHPNKEKLIVWADKMKKQQEQFEKGSIKSLFEKSFKKVTPIIWYNWFVSSFVFFGITFILPITLTKLNKNDDNGDDDLLSIFFSSLGELPTIFVCAIIVNVPFLGRKNSWAISFAGGFLGCLLIYLELGSFTFWVSFSKLALDLAFTLSYEYTGEIYPTKVRAEGMGMAGSFSRIGSIIMPWIGNYIGDIGIFLPYFIFSICCALASFLTFLLPFETRGQSLDTFS